MSRLASVKEDVNISDLNKELSFSTARSGGSGGQHVNKVASKIELQFDVDNSEAFSPEEKEQLLQVLKNRLTKHHILILQCDESRSQHKNKTLIIKRFLEIINKGLETRKERKPTKVPKSAKQKRLEVKRNTAAKKANRKPPTID